MKKYYFQEKVFKIRDKYWVKDEDGVKSFYIYQKLKLIGYHVYVYDRGDKFLFSVKKKLIAWLPKFKIDFANGSKMQIKSRYTLFRKSIDINTNFGKLNLRGNIIDHKFQIKLGKELVGEISKKFMAITDEYELTVYDEKFTEALIALVLCLNKIKDDELEAINDSVDSSGE